MRRFDKIVMKTVRRRMSAVRGTAEEVKAEAAADRVWAKTPAARTLLASMLSATKNPASIAGQQTATESLSGYVAARGFVPPSWPLTPRRSGH